MLSSNKIFLAITTTLLILLTNLSCHRTPIEPEKTKVNLIYEDALCTEAYFRLKTTEINYPARVDLYLNKDKVNSFTTFSDDTVFVIENLLPKKSYTSYVRVYPEGGGELVSSEVSFVTMDTTSHDFTWQVFEFGQWGNSVLFDVAIIDENNIWAVGEIRVYDSLGREVKYNAVHWNGSKWELKRIYHYSSCNPVDYPPFRSIIAFSDKEIILTSGGSIGWFNGITNRTDCGIRPLLTGRINKLWGTSSSDLYAVGDNGNIVHWDGMRWKKIESGTDIRLTDIWGTSDGKIVWACGWDLNKTVLVKIENNQASVVFEANLPTQEIKNKLSGVLNSLWTNNNKFVYILTWANLYRCYNNTKGDGRELYPSNDYFMGAYLRLRGTSINNLFTCGHKSTITHFNGLSWKIYGELRNEDQILTGLDVSDNLVVAVGEKFEGLFNNKALIIVGKR